jgi:hypothetical protein
VITAIVNPRDDAADEKIKEANETSEAEANNPPRKCDVRAHVA